MHIDKKKSQIHCIKLFCICLCDWHKDIKKMKIFLDGELLNTNLVHILQYVYLKGTSAILYDYIYWTKNVNLS